jgi:hypothetical protein
VDAPDSGADKAHSTLGLRFPVGYQAVTGQHIRVTHRRVVSRDYYAIWNGDRAHLDGTEKKWKLVCHLITSIFLSGNILLFERKTPG